MRFANSVVNSSRLDFSPLLSESIVFDLECWMSWPICVSLDELAILFSMSQHCLQSTWFKGGHRSLTL